MKGRGGCRQKTMRPGVRPCAQRESEKAQFLDEADEMRKIWE